VTETTRRQKAQSKRQQTGSTRPLPLLLTQANCCYANIVSQSCSDVAMKKIMGSDIQAFVLEAIKA
jgi:hypothetical protein